MTVDNVASYASGLEIDGVVWTGTVEIGDRLEVREGERLVGYAEVDSVTTGARRLPGGEPVLRLRIDGVDELAAGMVATRIARGGLEPSQLISDGAAGLTIIDAKTVLQFRGTWHWAHARTFRIDPGLSDHALLGGLLSHPEYRDEYTSDRLTDEPLHGPYNLVRITPEAFDAISSDAAIETFRRWVDDAAAEAHEVGGNPSSVEAVISASDVVYQLRDLGPRAAHHFGWILYDFLELVLIHRTSHRLHLLVAAGD